MLQKEDVAIALAEDDDDLRKLLIHMLDELGYTVVCAAANGAELLETCFDADVDVALVDLDMPLIDGLEAAEEVSKRGIPVILVSGLMDLEGMVVEEEPIAARLSKPVNSRDLKTAIESALSGSGPRRPR